MTTHDEDRLVAGTSQERGDNALRPIRSVNLHHDFTLSFKWKYASSSFCTQTGFDDTSGRRSQCPDA